MLVARSSDCMIEILVTATTLRSSSSDPHVLHMDRNLASCKGDHNYTGCQNCS